MVYVYNHVETMVGTLPWAKNESMGTNHDAKWCRYGETVWNSPEESIYGGYYLHGSPNRRFLYIYSLTNGRGL